ncbi:LOG family protein [Ceratocystis lukuohia]|uniref:LOG family protein n=3 Tax=Ceratocystis TaxID=5157 RepID=A0A0F8BXQ3_CERFI|nr:LOG family protein [Ceratocystis platani]PHH51826.1 LOG family protein YJL055W [Ceratocystis fimbriata CBS 114723]
MALTSEEPVKAPRTKICVYCGSSPGTDAAHVEAARALATAMAENDIDLVYGGGTVGLMGEVAKTLVALKGPDAVHGIIPEALIHYERDDTYATQTSSNLFVPTESIYGRTTVVPDMHTRKRLMAQEVFSGGPGSGFIALAGGYGTLEEVFETVTWNQLGIHKNGIVLLNVNGFYDGLIEWIKGAHGAGFIKGDNVKIIATATTAQSAIDELKNYKQSKSTFDLKWGTE